MEQREKRLVIALSGSLGCALLLVAFLLGRLSANPSAVEIASTPPDATPSQAREGIVPLTPASREAISETIDSPPLMREPSNVPDAARDVLIATPAATPPSSSAGQSQIAGYFSQIDRIDDLGAGDPQAFAASMVESMSSGDFSGFDSLLAKSRAQRQKLLALTPPPACLEHHRLALTLSSDSVSMLERLKAALAKGDPTQLLTMAEKGRTLEAQANRLKSMGEQIKRQAGL